MIRCCQFPIDQITAPDVAALLGDGAPEFVWRRYRNEDNIKMDIILRREKPSDYYAVENLTRQAFWNDTNRPSIHQIPDEHLLVHRLRSAPSFIPELDYVAEVDGKIVGHIIYSTGYIKDASGQTHEVLTFGPLSVLPEYQHQGIGKALLRHTLALAKQLGYRAVIIFGIPDYYPKVGFRRADEFGLTTANGKTFDPFMAYPLYDGALAGISGSFHLDPVYENLTQADALTFDTRFPPTKSPS